jgi:hypothetical protein
MSGVAKEDAKDGPRSEFMRNGGGQVWVTFATKDSQVIVRRRRTIESKVRHGEVESLGGQDVEQGGCHGESLDPVGGRHGRLKEQGANDITDRVNNAFGFTILRRSGRGRTCEGGCPE